MKPKSAYRSILIWGLLTAVCIVLLSFSSFAESISGPGDGLPEYSSNHGGIIYQGDKNSTRGDAIAAVAGSGVISDDPETQAGASADKETAQNEGAQEKDVRGENEEGKTPGVAPDSASEAGTASAPDTTVQEGEIFIHDGVRYKKGEFKGNFRLSGYENSAGNPTYSGKMPRVGHTVAADLSVLPIGTMIIIEGTSGKTVESYDGVYEVEDTGSGVNGNHLDIFQGSYGEAAAVTHHGWQYSDVWIAVPAED